MTDVLNRAERSERMSLIRSSDSKFERLVRSALHKLGYRYKKNDDRLPGRPDLVFPSREKVIFLHGCFWHGHGCRLDRRPKSNKAYWNAKLARNRACDAAVARKLRRLGWGVLTVWECELSNCDRMLRRMDRFLHL